MADNNSSSNTFLENIKPIAKLWANTCSKVQNIHFTWTVHNFSLHTKICSQIFQSPTFYVDSDDDIKWYLKLHTNSNTRNTHLGILLYLVSESSTTPEVLVKYKFSILNTKPGKTVSTMSSEFLKADEISGIGANNLIGLEALLTKDSGFLVDNELKCVCEVSYISETINVSNQKSNEQFDVSECNLFDDLGSLLENKKFSDVILMVGEHQFPAHKAILAARSDVFAAMFEHDMQESKLGRVTIVDVDQEVVQEMLRFIYTGKAPNLEKMAAELYVAADKYQLKKLKGMSQQAMFDGLSIETAAKTLVLANHLSADQLKEQTMRFIKIHGVNVIKTKGWQDMIHANDNLLLLGEAFEALFK